MAEGGRRKADGRGRKADGKRLAREVGWEVRWKSRPYKANLKNDGAFMAAKV